MNDPMIYAPLSKIVEAIKKSISVYELELDAFEELEIENAVEGALLSLDCQQYKRKVLEDYQEWCRNLPPEAYYWSTEVLLDRYLAEKQSKAEKK